MKARFRSLRTRLLIPLAGCSLVAAIAVGAVSYVLGDRVVQRSMNSRFEAIRSTLSTATFPLTPSVLKTLAELTETELASYGRQGHRIDASHPGAPATLDAEAATEGNAEFDPQILPGYQARHFDRRHSGNNPAAVTHVLVMFDERDLQQARLAAASLPLATGLSSTLLLSIVALALTERMIHRIGALEQSVKRIAAGEFGPRSTGSTSTGSTSTGSTSTGPTSTGSTSAGPTSRGPEPGGPTSRGPSRSGFAERGRESAAHEDSDLGDFEPDELGRLGAAVRKMGSELAILWEAVHRQERQKLIHQIAAGLAHQLRNSLTGARMAVELHARRCPIPRGDGLDVAVRELERTEDYVQRILRVASQQRETGTVGTVGEATEAVRGSLQVVAEHQRVALSWSTDEKVRERRVADVAGLTAALENLVINAIQAGGNSVEILAACVEDRVQIKVSDNGPGPSEAVGLELFEPFVTTKPEGLGLGLPLVRRTAEDLGGEVRWFRDDSQTVFVLTVTPLA